MTSVDRIQGLSGSLAVKAPCRVATTANITLSGEQTIDGVAVVEGDRVLVKDQTDTTENGIYDASTGAWTRALDFDGANDVVRGTLVNVVSGTVGGGFVYELTTANPITIGTTSLAFAIVFATVPVSAFAVTLLDAADAAAARTTLGTGAAVQSQTDTAFTTGGTATAFTLTPVPAITANGANQRFRVKFNAASGVTPTLAVSGQTAKNLKYYDATATKQAVTSVQIPTNWISDVEYDGTDWVVLDVCAAPGVAQNSQSAAYTTVLADAQKHILHPTADNNARTFTIDSNANVPYPIGTAITFVNQINTVTIAITSDTLTLAGIGTTGSRTLAARGMATALKVSSTVWYISGSGLS